MRAKGKGEDYGYGYGYGHGYFNGRGMAGKYEMCDFVLALIFSFFFYVFDCLSVLSIFLWLSLYLSTRTRT